MSRQDQRNAGLKISFAVSRAHPSPSDLQVGERCDKASNEERNIVSVAIAGWHKPGKDFSQCSRNHGHGRQAQRCQHRRPKSSERRRRYWLAEVQHRNDRGSPAAWLGGWSPGDPPDCSTDGAERGVRANRSRKNPAPHPHSACGREWADRGHRRPTGPAPPAERSGAAGQDTRLAGAPHSTPPRRRHTQDQAGKGPDLPAGDPQDPLRPWSCTAKTCW